MELPIQTLRVYNHLLKRKPKPTLLSHAVAVLGNLADLHLLHLITKFTVSQAHALWSSSTKNKIWGGTNVCSESYFQVCASSTPSIIRIHYRLEQGINATTATVAGQPRSLMHADIRHRIDRFALASSVVGDPALPQVGIQRYSRIFRFRV